MKTEDFLNISMSLASKITPEEKVEMLLSVHTKSNPKDWSAAFVSYTLSKLGYPYSTVDVPANYLNLGDAPDVPELGDVVVFRDEANNIKVGFFYKELSSKQEEIENIIILITTNDDNGIHKETIKFDKLISYRRLLINKTEPSKKVKPTKAVK